MLSSTVCKPYKARASSLSKTGLLVIVISNQDLSYSAHVL